MMSFLYSMGLALGMFAQRGAPSDVPANHWAFKSVDDLYSVGILQGYPGGTYRGDAAVSNYEVAAMLGSLSNAEDVQFGTHAARFGGGLCLGCERRMREVTTLLRVESPGH